jgi:hypothetical protein
MVSDRKKYLENIFLGVSSPHCIRNRQFYRAMTTVPAQERRRIVVKNCVWSAYSAKQNWQINAILQWFVVCLQKADENICDY